MVSHNRLSKVATTALFQNLTGHPYYPPKFTLGDKVYYRYVHTDQYDLENFGRVSLFTGYVTGLLWCPEVFSKGWTYQIHWVDCDGWENATLNPTSELIEQKYLSQFTG